MDQYNQVPFGYGSAITHSQEWVPISCFAQTNLEIGNHTIELKIRLLGDNLRYVGHFFGAALFTSLFPQNPKKN